jgi:hypothetical protein
MKDTETFEMKNILKVNSNEYCDSVKNCCHSFKSWKRYQLFLTALFRGIPQSHLANTTA